MNIELIPKEQVISKSRGSKNRPKSLAGSEGYYGKPTFDEELPCKEEHEKVMLVPKEECLFRFSTKGKRQMRCFFCKTKKYTTEITEFYDDKGHRIGSHWTCKDCRDKNDVKDMIKEG